MRVNKELCSGIYRVHAFHEISHRFPAHDLAIDIASGVSRVCINLRDQAVRVSSF